MSNPKRAADGGPTPRLRLLSQPPLARPPLGPSSTGPVRPRSKTPDGLARPAGDRCFRCDQNAAELVELVAAHPNQPPRSPVALCTYHRDRHISGSEGIGWCERGSHHGRADSYCDVHLGTIT